MSQYPGTVPVEDVHRWKTEATQRLLGYTIAFTEDEWHQPVRLPGWSRAHVATHLARNAEYLDAILAAAIIGRDQPESPSASQQRVELEVGADRNGLALQIDLDATAGALQKTIESITDWAPLVRLHEDLLPLSAVPLSRLHEVNLHLIDLDCGFATADIPAESAEWLLRWALYRLRNANLPAMTITTDTLRTQLGLGTDFPMQIEGSDVAVWAWLTGRADPATIAGAEDLVLPLLG